MKRLIVALTAVSTIMALGGTSPPEQPLGPKAHTADRVDVARDFGTMRLSFEPNVGQAAPRVKFLSHGQTSTVLLTPTGAVLSLAPPRPVPSGEVLAKRQLPSIRAQSDVIGMTFVGANADASMSGAEQLQGVSNYFIGDDPSRWRTGVPHYARVTYRGLYPGIDLSFYGNQGGRLEYDLSVAAGADPSVIRLSIRGSDAMTIDPQGDLVLRLGGRDIVQPGPRIYQDVSGLRRAIAGGYVLEGNQVGFSLGAYDQTRPLVIDPQIVYSTYLGGSGQDSGEIHPSVDGSGHAFICGATTSTDFPITPGALQPTLIEGYDGFVTEMKADGSGVVFSTFLGGTGSFDDVQDCKADPSGNVYIGGLTDSPDFPVTPGAFQSVFKGGSGAFICACDGFVGKIGPVGSNLIYSTYLGGSGDENLNNVQMDAAGDAFVAGDTFSTDFPTTPGAYQTSNADGHGVGCPGVRSPMQCNDEFVAKLNPVGTRLLYSTYIGGRGSECCQPGLAVDAQGNAYIEGNTSSPTFPTTPGALQPHFAGGLQDAFVTKIDPTGSTLVYSTYLGGSFIDGGSLSMAVDASGNAYVDGWTCSQDFPVTPGAFQSRYAGPHGGLGRWCGDDLFVSKINPAGSALVYSTYLGGSGGELVSSVVVDSAGRAYIPASTDSTDFPVTADAFQPTNHGLLDGTVTELTADGSGIIFSSYLGGTASDGINGATLDPSGNLYVTGCTESSDFPTTPGAFQTVFHGGVPPGFGPCGGSMDAFVTKIAFGS